MGPLASDSDLKKVEEQSSSRNVDFFFQFRPWANPLEVCQGRTLTVADSSRFEPTPKKVAVTRVDWADAGPSVRSEPQIFEAFDSTRIFHVRNFIDFVLSSF